jgi:hypothetical protein
MALQTLTEYTCLIVCKRQACFSEVVTRKLLGRVIASEMGRKVQVSPKPGALPIELHLPISRTGDPGGTRTRDPWITNPDLYPAEIRGLTSITTAPWERLTPRVPFNPASGCCFDNFEGGFLWRLRRRRIVPFAVKSQNTILLEPAEKRCDRTGIQRASLGCRPADYLASGDSYPSGLLHDF